MSTVKKLLKDKAKTLENGLYKEVALICSAIGSEYKNQEKYEDALEEHLEELKYCEMCEDELSTAQANRSIGECYAALNKFKKAIHHIKLFFDISVKLNSVIEEQRAWATFGRTYYMKYEYDKASRNENDNSLSETLDRAELAYCKALKLLPSINSDVSTTEFADMKCRLLLNLGLLYEARGNLEKSFKYVKEGLEIAEENNLYEAIHLCGHALGTFYQKMKKHVEAVNVLNRALKPKLNKNLTSELLFLKSTNLICIEKYAEAKKCLKSAYKLHTTNSEDFGKIIKSLKICIGIENYEKKLKTCKILSERKLMLEKIADALSSIDCFDLAIKKYHMTLDCLTEANLPPSEKAPIFFSLAQTYVDNKNIPKALEYFDKEFNCNKEKPIEQIQTLWKIAEIFEDAKETDKCEEFYKKAVSLAEETGNQKYIYNSLNKLLALYKKINKTNTAEEIKNKIDSIVDNYSSDEEDINEEPFNDIPLSEMSDSDDNEEQVTVRKRSKKFESKVNEKGETPLHQASISGNLTSVKRLIENGHSVNVRDFAGWTPLHEASNHGFYEIAEFLIENGANINDPGGPECKGITALHDAASCGNIDVVHLLISKGANVTAVDENGETPLDALLQWKERTELDDVTLKQCKAAEEELKLKMLEAGITQNIIHNSSTPDFVDNTCQNINITGKRNRSYSSSSNCGSEEDIVRISPYLNEDDNINWNDAKAEYKSVMENLRRSAANTISPVKSQKPKVSGPSLVNENEIVNDWLVRDTGKIPKTKRKKRRIHKLNVRTSKCIDKYLISQDSEEKAVQSYSDNSNSSITTVNSLDINTIKNNQEQQSCSAKKSVCSTVTFCLRVNVTGKLILVPVPEENCTVDWLKEEASSRFQDIDGSKPHLTLMKDGALLSGSDLIKSIFSNNEEVLSSVEMWDESSLDEKYVQLCNKHDITVSSDIRKKFCDLITSFEMNLSNCYIPSTQLKVVLHTLINYKSLRVLNLSCVPLSSSNVTILVSSVPNLSSLHTLNLSCCGLTSETIEIFLDYLNLKIANGITVLSSLKIIDLSYNFFSPFPDFSSFFKLNSVSSLYLCSCGLDSTFLSGNLLKAIEEQQNLEVLDISDSTFNGDDISNFLKHLPKDNLKKLNLKSVVKNNEELGFKLQSFFTEKLPHLKEISLQGCFLTDTDLNLISTYLISCSQIQIIDISLNPLLSSYCITNFLNRLLESSLTITALNISGTCIWDSHNLSVLKDCLKLKMLKHLTFDNCSEAVSEKMMQFWFEKWGNDALYSNNLFFCVLSVK